MSLFMESVFSTRFWILSHLCHPRKLTCLYKNLVLSEPAVSDLDMIQGTSFFLPCIAGCLLLERSEKQTRKTYLIQYFSPLGATQEIASSQKPDPVMNTNDIASILEQYLRLCSPLLLAFVETFASHNHWNHLYYSRNNRLLDGLCRPWWSGA